MPHTNVKRQREAKKQERAERRAKKLARVKDAASALDNGNRRPRHPFKANYLDHFETSMDALQHLLPAIRAHQELTHPSCPEKYCIYDPYYCAGKIVELWRQLGIATIHEDRDFYKDIEEGTVPPFNSFDILVTNPPFSGDHVERLFHFLVEKYQRPFAVLLPDYIATKKWYQELIETHFASAQQGPRAPWPLASSAPTPPKKLGVEPSYIVPRQWYNFEHVDGTGHDKSHFKSMWYVWFGARTGEVMRGASCVLSSESARIIGSVSQLVEQKIVRTNVRVNPRERRKRSREGEDNGEGEGD